ncbi:MAG: sensor histidine kinase [Alkalispirochaeta sp.]
MKIREVTPFIIASLIILALLFPMNAAFRAGTEVSTVVSELQLEWLRLGITIDTRNGAAVATFADQLKNPQLQALSRFSAPLAATLDRIPDALTHVEIAVRSGDREATVAAVQTVDALLDTVATEAAILDAQRSAAYASLVSFSFIAATAFAMLWIYQIVRVQRFASAAEESKRVATLERRVQDHERRRLARELHDGAAQELAVARLALDRLTPDDAVSSLRSAIISAAEEIRLIHRALDPRFTAPDELMSLIHKLAANIEHRSSQKIDVHNDSLHGIQWTPEMQLHLFRITQEGLHNVVRHAGASTASITLRVQDTNHVVLRIMDDGVGLNGSVEGYGRRGIRERVELMGGTVSWSAGEHGGTVVEAIVPVRSSPERRM